MKQKKTAGRKKAAKYKKYAGYVVIFILLAAVVAVLVEFEVLSTVQAGGMLFLAAGIFIYVTGIQTENFQKGERKKSQVSDDFDEEMGTCILQQGKNIKIGSSGQSESGGVWLIFCCIVRNPDRKRRTAGGCLYRQGCDQPCSCKNSEKRGRIFSDGSGFDKWNVYKRKETWRGWHGKTTAG